MKTSPSDLACVLICLACFGCSGNAVRTMSSGSHVPYSSEQSTKIENNQNDKLRFIVWSNHAGTTHAAGEVLQHSGHTIVERTRVQEFFDKRHIRLTHTSDDDLLVLKVGRLAGADHVLFVEASDKPEIASGPNVEPSGRASRSNTGHEVSVAVRSVDLETGAVRWKGYSTFTQPITDLESAIPLLTKAAILRATCAWSGGGNGLNMGRNTQVYGAVEGKSDLPRPLIESRSYVRVGAKRGPDASSPLHGRVCHHVIAGGCIVMN